MGMWCGISSGKLCGIPAVGSAGWLRFSLGLETKADGIRSLIRSCQLCPDASVCRVAHELNLCWRRLIFSAVGHMPKENQLYCASSCKERIWWVDFVPPAFPIVGMIGHSGRKQGFAGESGYYCMVYAPEEVHIWPSLGITLIELIRKSTYPCVDEWRKKSINICRFCHCRNDVKPHHWFHQFWKPQSVRLSEKYYLIAPMGIFS